MVRTIVDARRVVAMLIAASVGMWGLHTYPVPPDDPFLGLIQLREPVVFQVLAYGYATLWFTTPFFLASLLTSARDRGVSPGPNGTVSRTPSLFGTRNA